MLLLEERKGRERGQGKDEDGSFQILLETAIKANNKLQFHYIKCTKICLSFYVVKKMAVLLIRFERQISAMYAMVRDRMLTSLFVW
jgi:hypothetical protein